MSTGCDSSVHVALENDINTIACQEHCYELRQSLLDYSKLSTSKRIKVIETAIQTTDIFKNRFSINFGR